MVQRAVVQGEGGEAATTDGTGAYTLHVPATLTTGTVLKIIETNPSAYLSTGAGVGTTGGVYLRAADLTTFTLAACGAPLPSNLASCAVTQQPAPNATGAIEWTLTGTLAPGASGTVTYTVRVQN